MLRQSNPHPRYISKHPELRSTLMIQGARIAKARDLGVIDTRQSLPPQPK